MKRHSALALPLIALLAACAGQNSYESIKGTDFKPEKTLLAIHLTTTPLDESFEKRMTENFAKCGVNLQFSKAINPKIVAAANADGVLTLEVLGGTQYVNWKDPTAKSSLRSVLVQLTLIDVESEKNIWRSRTDLRNGVENLSTRTANETSWADELSHNMAHDGILGNCSWPSSSPAPNPATLVSLKSDKPRTVLYCENPRGYYPAVPNCATPFKEIPDELKLKEH